MSRITLTRIAVATVATLAISFGGPAASAYWQTLGSNPGTAKADAIATMSVPTASASGGAAGVSWAPGTTTGGQAVSGYTVSRYSSATGGTMVAAGGGCGGIVTATTCSEAALPPGTWYYSVKAKLGSWAGPESARSGGVAGAPLSSPTINSPDIVNIAKAGRVEISGTAGAGLSVTVTATDAGGVYRVSQPVSAGGSGQWTVSNFNLTGLADGTITYTAVATDAAGNVSAPSPAVWTTKDTRAPAVTGVTLSNGGSKVGKMEPGDKVVLKFSKALDLSSICSTWSNGSQPIGGSGAVVTVSVGDSLSVSIAACPTFRFGSVALGGSYYGSGNLQFGGSSLAWDQSALQLTVTLGSVSSGSPGTANQTAGTPKYTPDAGVTDIAGNPLPTTQVSGASPSRF